MTSRHMPFKRSSYSIMAIAATVILILLLSPQLSIIKHWDWRLQDTFIRERAASLPASDDIVIVDIDDTSLTAMAPLIGKWPWPRSIHSELIEFLNNQGAQAIVFDVLFIEPDIYRPDSDAYFAEVIAETPNVFLPVATRETSSALHTPLLASYPAELGLTMGNRAERDARSQILLPEFVPKEHWRLGSIDFSADSDGVGRRYYISQNLSGWKLQSLPAVVAQSLGAEQTEKDRFLIDWRGASGIDYQSFSYAQLLSQARGEQRVVPEDFFKDRIVVVGSTALGLHDFRRTPVNHAQPGVFILATAIDNLLNGDSLHYYDTLPLSAVTIVLLLCITYLIHLDKARLGAVSSLFCMSLILLIGWQSALAGTLVEIVPSLLSLAMLALLGIVLSYQRHHKQLTQTVQLFSRFMDPAVVKQIIDEKNTDSLIGSKSVEVTMLFSDIRNFTSMSEQRTPGEVVNMLNHYFDLQVQSLFKHGATLDKFIGDAIMAFWGAPLAQADHPVKAVNAALDMVDNLQTFIDTYGYKEFDIGIGIHTGSAVVGLVGSHERYDYTAIGDTVNLASRIEGLTKNCAQILVSETTMEACKGHFDFEAKGEFTVKGRQEPVKVYEPKRRGV